MIEKRDIPKEIHPFHEVFMKLYGGGYKHDISTLFSDFLNISVSNFTLVPNPELKKEIENRYSQEEIILLGNLFQAWVTNTDTILGQRTEKDGFAWCDILGNYYEALSSMYKKQNFGQFFTPEAVVNLTASITITVPEDSRVVTISDPCSGSGRMLLAAHCRLKGRCVCFAEDIDGMCAKMTVLNFLIHGVEGEVIHHDSLMPESFINGWHVNPGIKEGAPAHIRKIKADESHIVGMWKRRRENIEANPAPEVKDKKNKRKQLQPN